MRRMEIYLLREDIMAITHACIYTHASLHTHVPVSTQDAFQGTLTHSFMYYGIMALSSCVLSCPHLLGARSF